MQRTRPTSAFVIHGVLGVYTIIALWPIFLILINSFKSRKAIFRDPMALPTLDSFDLIGFEKVLAKSNFLLYFANSMIVTRIRNEAASA